MVLQFPEVISSTLFPQLASNTEALVVCGFQVSNNSLMVCSFPLLSLLVSSCPSITCIISCPLPNTFLRLHFGGTQEPHAGITGDILRQWELILGFLTCKDWLACLHCVGVLSGVSFEQGCEHMHMYVSGFHLSLLKGYLFQLNTAVSMLLAHEVGLIRTIGWFTRLTWSKVGRSISQKIQVTNV